MKKGNINQLKAGVILSYTSMILGYIISIIYTPIMLRLLGQSEYGLYNLVSSVISYLGLFSFGFSSAYMRYYSKYKVNEEKENISKLNGMFIIVYSIIGIISILAGVLLITNIDIVLGGKLTNSELNTASILMVIMVFNMAISFPASVFSSYITANEQYIFQKIVQVIRTVINPFIMLPVLFMGYKSIGMVVVTTILTIIIEMSNMIFCLKKLNMKFSFNKFDFSLMREMAVFSSFIFINMIIDQINWNVDKFILGKFRGTVAVAVYGVAAQLNTYYISLSSTISSVFIPRVHKMVALNDNNKELTAIFTKVGRIQFIILSLICTGLIFFGRTFINMWAGKGYEDAYFIVLLLVIPAIIPLMQNLGIEIQRAKNMHKFRSWVYLFIAIGNLVISIPLATRYGGIGSAIGTAISLFIGNGIIMNWYYYAKVKLDMKYFWSEILKLSRGLVIPIIFGIVISINIDLNNILVFLICGISYVIVFSLSMCCVGMNTYEKELIGKPISKLFGKMRLSKLTIK